PRAVDRRPPVKFESAETARIRQAPIASGRLDQKNRARTRRKGTLPERRHHVLGEPVELFLEFLGRDAFGPVDHDVLEGRILRLDGTDAIDNVLGRTTEPGLLLNAVLEARRPRGCARGTPGAALLVGVAYETERCEPFVALVVRGLDPADRLLLGVGEI